MRDVHAISQRNNKKHKKKNPGGGVVSCRSLVVELKEFTLTNYVLLPQQLSEKAMFSWLWNSAENTDSFLLDDEAAYSWPLGRSDTPTTRNRQSANDSPPHDDDGSFPNRKSAVIPIPFYDNDTDEIPGTLAYFQYYRQHLQAQLVHPPFFTPAAPPFLVWNETLTSFQTARQSLTQAQQVLQDLQKQQDPTPAQQALIDQAQEAVKASQAAVEECQATVRLVGDSILNHQQSNHNDNDSENISIPQFLSQDFDDSAWITYMVLQDPQHWASWCCHQPQNQSTTSSGETPDPARVAVATSFLLNVTAQRRILGEGGGAPRGGNYGGYLEILQRLDSSSSVHEPVLERLAQAVALEFANGDYCYFDSTQAIDPVARYLHYEQAYLMGDLDPAFSTLQIWELRLVVNSSSRDWELQWGRECLQTYRPDWALTDDVQWRYCRLVRLDVGYTNPTWTSRPHTMDQILSGGGM